MNVGESVIEGDDSLQMGDDSELHNEAETDDAIIY